MVAASLVSSLALLAATASSHAATPHTAAAPGTCATVPVRLLDAELAISAVAVSSVHPASPKGSLICSYYGASGHAANQATIVFLRANAVEFAGIRRRVSDAHRVTGVAHLGAAAFSYSAPPETYLYLLDGPHFVEIYAAVRVQRLEALGHRVVLLLR